MFFLNVVLELNVLFEMWFNYVKYMSIDVFLILDFIFNKLEFYEGRKCILRRGWYYYYIFSF